MSEELRAYEILTDSDMNSVLVSSLMKTSNVKVLPGGRMGGHPPPAESFENVPTQTQIPSPPDGRFLGSF